VDAVLQLHPTRACNLRCLHCYSNSGPQHRDALDIKLLNGAITDACHEGYTRVSVSGGEPLMYRHLRPLLEHARGLGLHTSLTTNGTLIRPQVLAWLPDLVDVIAVSVDGVPVSHNRIRGSGQAFELMRRGLIRLREAGIAFAVIFTLTQDNLDELPWVVEFSAGHGARIVQVHPLEGFGRAVTDMAGEIPDEQETAQGWFAAQRLNIASLLTGQSEQAAMPTLGACSPEGARPRVHIDLADCRHLIRQPALVLGPPPPQPNLQLSQAVRPLVVEDDGTVVPLTYGFLRTFMVGNLHSVSLGAASRIWMRARYPDYRQHCERALDELRRPRRFPFINWYEHVATLSVVRL
jgi:Fe-coproporphyrin III synthase